MWVVDVDAEDVSPAESMSRPLKPLYKLLVADPETVLAIEAVSSMDERGEANERRSALAERWDGPDDAVDM